MQDIVFIWTRIYIEIFKSALVYLLRKSLTFLRIHFLILIFGMKIVLTFLKKNLQFIRPSFFNCHNPKWIKLVTRLCTGLSHLREHKYKHSFQDSLNLICRCGTDVESCLHFFLHCHIFQNERLILLSIVKNIDSKWLD